MRSKANHVRWLVCVLFLLVTGHVVSAQIPVPNPSGPPKIIYVDADATGANIGSSWEHAINSLQDALLVACFYDKPVEIRVSQGIYTPDRGLGIMPGDSSALFELMNGVTIKGGYAASLRGHRGGQEFDVRDINQYKSILSGDLNADDGPGLTNIEENSYIVVTASGTNETAVLDGFTITGSGIAVDRPVPYNHSGGMYNDNSSPTLIDCTFSENQAAENGGGMYNNSSNPVLLNCTFSGNDAPQGGSGMYNENSSPTLTNCTFVENRVGGGGAGMYNVNSNPVLLNCIFTANIAHRSGGGMYNDHSSPVMTNCIFTENSGGDDGGGGMFNEESSPKLADCVFRKNSTTGSGGGMFNIVSYPTLLNCKFTGNSAEDNGGGIDDNMSFPTLTNCTFTGNSASYGGAIHCFDSAALIINNTILNNLASGRRAVVRGGGIYCDISSPTVVNTILWNNHPDEIYGPRGREITASITVTYSDVEGGFPGEGNIDVEPMFVDAENGDYHLKSQAGRWDPASESWVIDGTSSLCIDTGNPNDPVGLERFPNGGRINMGVHGGTPEASLSPRQISFLPGQASNPTPAEGVVDVDVNIILKWAAGFDAVSHNVFFGTSVDDMDTMLVSLHQAGTEFDLERLDYEFTYYWRIDEVNSDGEVITGVVWIFTTVPPSPPPKGRGCFLADTPVWVNGALAQISKVIAGQRVGKFTCIANTSMQIEKLEEHEGTFVCYDVLLESGNCISVADCHYFLTETGRWVALQNLETGMKLQTSKGSIGIISVNKRPMSYVGKVYNLKIEGSDRYLVGEDAVIVRDY